MELEFNRDESGVAMTVWSRRELLARAGMGAAAAWMAPGLLVRTMWAEEPHPVISPLNKLTDEDEIALGKRFSEELEKELTVIENPLIDRYLGGMVKALAAQSQRPDLPYSIKLVNSHVPNAASLPGGFLYLNRGLVEMIQTEGEMVATLAHEIGHVVGRHTVNHILAELHARAMLKPVLDNLQSNPGVVNQIILKLGGAVAMLAAMHFSRKDELEADLLGFYEVLRAGWDPHAFLELFARFDALEKASGQVQIPFLSDHPPTPQRLEAIRRELTQVQVPANAANDSMKFKVFKAAMTILPEPPKKPQPQEQPSPQGY
ncbi:MAG: M48 family metalloprotease [Terracidiphilus sp.]